MFDENIFSSNVIFRLETLFSFTARILTEYSNLPSFFFLDCGGYVHLKENDLVLEREKVAFITSPNYPGPIGLGKICRWAVTVISSCIIYLKMITCFFHYDYYVRKITSTSSILF